MLKPALVESSSNSRWVRCRTEAGQSDQQLSASLPPIHLRAPTNIYTYI